jgi:hypothetical protein
MNIGGSPRSWLVAELALAVLVFLGINVDALVQFTIYFEPVVKFLSALATPIIAAIVGYIAYQQHIVNRNRLQFERYEKQLSVFKAVERVLVTHHLFNKDAVSELIQKYSESWFLFDDDVIPKYLEEILDLAVELNQLKDQQNASISAGAPPKPDTLKRLAEIDKQLQKETIRRARELFGKYLKLK